MYILCTSICKKKRNIDLHIFLSILFDIIKKKKKRNVSTGKVRWSVLVYRILTYKPSSQIDEILDKKENRVLLFSH